MTWEQVLRALGSHVVACTRRAFQELRDAGAAEIVDFSKDSFSEHVDSLSLVVDTVGVDVDGLASNLQRCTGAAYVSTMPSSIRQMQQKGMLGGMSLFASVALGSRPETAPTKAYWLPEGPGMELLASGMGLVAQHGLKVPLKNPGLDDYMDGILWPKDAETGGRFGFPLSEDKTQDDKELLQKYSQVRQTPLGTLPYDSQLTLLVLE